MSDELMTIPAVAGDRNELIRLTLQDCASPHTRRVYAARLRDFLDSGHPLTLDGVRSWLATVPMRPQTFNQCLAAIRKLVDEAEKRKLIEFQDAWCIRGIRARKKRGIRSGNWLTLQQVRELMALPDRTRFMGRRDAAVIALLLGCGLRRDEACQLTWGHYQPRDGRMCLVDVIGKGGRVRSMPVIEWARNDLDAWREDMKNKDRAGDDDRVLHRMVRIMRPDKKVSKMGMNLTSQGCWWIVKKYAGKLGLKVTPHDLRRTLAKQMRKAGSEWDQIQLMLGHGDIAVTQLYVGSLELDEGRAGVDLIPWEGNEELVKE